MKRLEERTPRVSPFRVMLCGLLAFDAGCATIIHGGTKQKAQIDSNPTGARVLIDGTERGVTPLALKLKRKEDYLVTLESPGYLPERCLIESSWSPWMFGNIIFGGIIGIVVDVASGGGFDLDPEGCARTLRPADAGGAR